MSINYLQSAQDDLVIDINNAGGVKSGSPLQALVKKTEANQWWSTEDVPGKSGYFWIVSADQNLVIDINNSGGIKSGSKLQALVQKNEDNQYWTAVDVPGMPGYFWLQSADQNLVIDIDNSGGVKSGSVLQALVKKSENNQYWKWVSAPVATPPNPLGSNSNYYLYGGLDSKGNYIPLKDVVVTINVTEDIVTNPPCSFQLNGYSPHNDLDSWQQYGISMAPSSNQLNSFAENWPLSGNNLFNIEPNGFITLPNDTTIPAGYKVVIQLNNDSSGNITGSVVTVYNGSSKLGSQTINLIGQPLAAGGNISAADLAPMVAFQLNFVGWANGDISSLTSGSGTFDFSSSTSMTAQSGEPADAESDYITAETANSIYSVLPSGSSTSFTQPFGIDTTHAPIAPVGKKVHARTSRFQPVATR
jgi:hypothetical protein